LVYILLVSINDYLLMTIGVYFITGYCILLLLISLQNILLLIIM
jgi:hypothetical protein